MGNGRSFQFVDPVEPFGLLSPGPHPESDLDLFGRQLRPAHIMQYDGRFHDSGFAPLLFQET